MRIAVWRNGGASAIREATLGMAKRRWRWRIAQRYQDAKQKRNNNTITAWQLATRKAALSAYRNNSHQLGEVATIVWRRRHQHVTLIWRRQWRK
jgi:hypothetical protein